MSEVDVDDHYQIYTPSGSALAWDGACAWIEHRSGNSGADHHMDHHSACSNSTSRCTKSKVRQKKVKLSQACSGCASGDFFVVSLKIWDPSSAASLCGGDYSATVLSKTVS